MVARREADPVEPAPRVDREALLRAKLVALVRSRWVEEGQEADAVAVSFLHGAALPPAHPGAQAFVLVEPASHRSLGGVLAWALRRGAGEVHLLVDRQEVAQLLARRAQPFALPVTVWWMDPPALRKADATGFSPPPPLAAEAARWVDVLRRAGVEPVVEFGVLSGEVLGLEVARVVDGRLEVGVGHQDRGAHRELEPGRPAEEQLAEVVAAIRRLRTPGAPPHLANSLAGERWLRAVLLAQPDLVGASRLAPLPPAVARGDLRVPVAALAAGAARDGQPLVVAASTGIDLDLVPEAADARRGGGAEGRLVLAVAPQDDHPRTRQLAALLREPAAVHTVPAGWRSLAGSL